MAGRRFGGSSTAGRRQEAGWRRQAAGGRMQKARWNARWWFLLSAACTLAPAAGRLLAQAPPSLKEFSHAKHLKLGNVAPVIAGAIDKGTYLGRNGAKIRSLLNSSNPCVACHRGLDESEAVSQANMPQMADCLVCHNQIDLPDSCAFCHPKGAQLKPASHVPGFLDTHSNKNSGLDLQSCAVCHGRKFTCLGCHLK
jgi:hypothetical protein